MVTSDCSFGKACRSLAEKLGGLPDGAQKHSRFSLLQKLGKMME
jgi:hypothetical protein